MEVCSSLIEPLLYLSSLVVEFGVRCEFGLLFDVLRVLFLTSFGCQQRADECG